MRKSRFQEEQNIAILKDYEADVPPAETGNPSAKPQAGTP